MAETNYTMGYSSATTSSHASRSVHSDAGFLVPHVKPAYRILDVGCGPGSITVGLAALVPKGEVVGVDLSDVVLAQARAAAAQGEANNTSFQQADLLAGLPFPDDSFDIVFSSQLFPHLPSQETRLQALAEMRRVLRPGGILATRDAAELHFYPRSYGPDRLWVGNMTKALGYGGSGETWLPGGSMPKLLRLAGFAPGQIRRGCRNHGARWDGATPARQEERRPAGCGDRRRVPGELEPGGN